MISNRSWDSHHRDRRLLRSTGEPRPAQRAHSLPEPAVGSPEPTTTSKYRTDFERIRHLGYGAYGTVVEARKLFDGRHYAIKIIRMEDQSREELLREVRALSGLQHGNVVRYYDVSGHGA